MKVIKTPTPKYLLIFYEKHDEVLNFYTNKDKVTYHKISAANMKGSEREKYDSAFIYGR